MLSIATFGQDEFVVERGKLDLRQWDAAETPVLSLDGEWAFRWNDLIQAKDFDRLAFKSYARLSRPWNEQFIDGEELPKNGHASYYLQVYLPPNTDSVSFDVPAVFNSYAFWVNGKLICSSGKVGESKETTEPRWMPQTVVVPTPGDTLDIIFHIANYQDTRGGCAEVMRIGKASYLPALNSRFNTSGIVLIILFAVTGLMCISDFVIRRYKSFLYLGLFSLAFMIRFLFSDLYFYQHLGVNFSWLTAAKIEYMTIPLILLSATFFMSAIYPQEFRRASVYFFSVLNVILMLFVLVASSAWFSSLLTVLQVVGLAFILYVIYVLIKAIIYQRTGAWISTLGLIVFAMVGFYNIYAFITISDLNRVVIHAGYFIALMLNAASLFYRTPVRLFSEEQDILRYNDLFRVDGSSSLN